MAVIKVTKKDLAMNALPSVQWVSAKLKMEGPTKSSNGKSYNYLVVATLGDDCVEAPGKEIRTYFNDTFGLGSMHPMFAAVRNIPVSALQEGDDLDTDEIQDAEVDVKLGLGTYNGQAQSTITDWLPLGKGTAGGGF